MDGRMIRCGRPTLDLANQLPLRRMQSAVVLKSDSRKQRHREYPDLLTFNIYVTI